MPRPNEIRAYQILNHSGKMVGKKVDVRKIDAITAYEVVQRDSAFKPGTKVFAFRIVKAVIKYDKIFETETVKGGDEMTLNQVTEQIALYRKFSTAPVKTQADRDADEDAESRERWNGLMELTFKADTDLDSEEVFDAIWISKNHIEQRDGGIFIPVPKGMSFVGVTLPDDNVFIPE